MKRILIGWLTVLLIGLALWNTRCSDGLFGQTDMMKLVTNWETTELVFAVKKTYIGATTNDLTNYSVTNHLSRLTNSQVFYFKPYGVFQWYGYSNDVTISTDSGSYIVNQVADKITIYSANSNLRITYAFGDDDSLRLSDFRIITSNTNIPFFTMYTQNIGGATNLILNSYYYKLVKTTN